MRWLCKLGIHKFRDVGHNSFVNLMPIRQCQRCGIGRQWQMAGWEMTFTREQMDELMKRARSSR